MAGRGSTNLAVRLAPVSALGATALPAAEIGAAENSAVVWGDCTGCHEIGPRVENATGPKPDGIFGRRAAGLSDFDDPKSLARTGHDGLVGTLETLYATIAKAKNPAVKILLVDPRIFVLGDASAQGDMPKSGFSANSQAKVAASCEATDQKNVFVDSFISQIGEDAELSKATGEEPLGWYAGITADIFG